MAESTYEIVFNGELAEGAERDTVITTLAGLFKTSNDKIARLFGGGEFILKSNLDEANAKRYQKTLHRAGAVCQIRARQPGAPQAEAASKPAEATAAETTATADAAVEATTAEKSTTESEAKLAAASTEMTIDPPGVTIIEPSEKTEAQIDTSAFTLAPVGSDVLEGEKPSAPPPPDTGDLSLAPVGADILEKKDKDKKSSLV